MVCLGVGFIGLIIVIVNDYWVYMGYCWLMGFMCSGIGLLSFVLVIELVGLMKWGLVGMLVFYFFFLGIMIFFVLVYFFIFWCYFYIIMFIFVLVYCVLVLFMVWEFF